MASLPATYPVFGTGGDDTISGTTRSDIVSALAGDDTARGLTGNDELWGGSGNDSLQGDSGHDKLYGSGGPNIVQVAGIHIADDYPVTVTFEGETAGYRNSFGYYKIDPETGAISGVDILWENASLQGSGGDLVMGQSQVSLDVQAGDQIGFFIVSNGFSYNDFDALAGGTLAFVDGDGSPATLQTVNPALVHIADDGTTTVIKHHAYHTAAFDETVAMNPDAMLHTTGILKTDMGTLTLGFEDLYGGGDLDFDDSVFTVDLGTANATLLNAHYRSAQGLPDLADVVDGDGADLLPPLEDNDTLRGGTGSDELWGHKGDDWLYGDTGRDELHGGSGADNLFGGSDVDTLFGNLGDDILYGEAGNDRLNGNSGDDRMYGGGHDDVLFGHSGDDRLYGEDGDDELFGGSGVDLLDGGSGHDNLSGGSGADTLSGGSGNDSLLGGSGDDLFDGGSGSDVIEGGAGQDQVTYAGWDSRIRADLSTGTVVGNGTDTLTSIEDLIATDYNDKIVGSRANNVLDGGTGDDYIVAHAGDDIVIGGQGRDYLNGASGADSLYGGTEDDTIRGGKGTDTIAGGAGDDLLWGGEFGRNDNAEDLFAFDLGCGTDTIMDFEVGTDRLALNGFEVLDAAGFLAAMSQTAAGVYVDLTQLGGALNDGLLFADAAVDDFDSFLL